jgi:hypothetical protein
MFVWIWLLFLVLEPSWQQSYTCDQQLYDFYVAKGYGAGMEPPAITPAPTELPTAVMRFGTPNRFHNYQFTLDPTFHPNSSYFTFDIPYCTENIMVSAPLPPNTESCRVSLHINVPKNISALNTCNDDFNLLTGRTRGFVYMENCTFLVRISFASPSFAITTDMFGDPVGVTETGMYTMDIRGLLQSDLATTEAEALGNYSNEQCDGTLNGADLALQTTTTQKQMVCTGPIFKCYAPLEPIQPVTRYACQDNATTGRLIWQVVSYEPAFHPPGLFFIGFCEPFDAVCNSYIRTAADNGTLNASLNLVLRSGTRRQFDSNSSNFDQIAYVLYLTDLNEYEPRLLLAPQDAHLATLLPCICNFSVDCYPNGTINLDNVSAFYSRYNVPVIADAGTDPLLELGQPNYTLDGTRSYTVDSGTLQFLWVLYSQPPGSPPVVIPNNMSVTTVIDTSQFVEGVYQFVLFTSDGQDVSHDLLNLTVVKALPYARITTPDPTPSFQFYHGVTNVTQSCAGPLTGWSPAILLDGTGSHAGTFNTSVSQNVTLVYAWESLSGPPLPDPPACGLPGLAFTAGLFDTNESEAYFIPNRTGYYVFKLTVSIPGVNFTSSDTIQIFVLPSELIHENLTFPLPNYTSPPYRNVSRVPSPVNQFPNDTDAPFATTPTTPTSVPAIMPAPPPLGVGGILIVTLIALGIFFALLMLLFIYAVMAQQERNSPYDRITEQDDGR